MSIEARAIAVLDETVGDDIQPSDMQLIMYAAMDPLEEAIKLRRAQQETSGVASALTVIGGPCFYGLVLPIEEYCVWAWLGLSRIKIFLVTDEAVLTLPRQVVEKRIGDAMNAVGAAVVNARCSPFYSGGEITSTELSKAADQCLQTRVEGFQTQLPATLITLMSSSVLFDLAFSRPESGKRSIDSFVGALPKDIAKVISEDPPEAAPVPEEIVELIETGEPEFGHEGIKSAKLPYSLRGPKTSTISQLMTVSEQLPLEQTRLPVFIRNRNSVQDIISPLFSDDDQAALTAELADAIAAADNRLALLCARSRPLFVQTITQLQPLVTQARGLLNNVVLQREAVRHKTLDVIDPRVEALRLIAQRQYLKQAQDLMGELDALSARLRDAARALQASHASTAAKRLSQARTIMRGELSNHPDLLRPFTRIHDDLAAQTAAALEPVLTDLLREAILEWHCALVNNQPDWSGPTDFLELAFAELPRATPPAGLEAVLSSTEAAPPMTQARLEWPELTTPVTVQGTLQRFIRLCLYFQPGCCLPVVTSAVRALRAWLLSAMKDDTTVALNTSGRAAAEWLTQRRDAMAQHLAPAIIDTYVYPASIPDETRVNSGVLRQLPLSVFSLFLLPNVGLAAGLWAQATERVAVALKEMLGADEEPPGTDSLDSDDSRSEDAGLELHRVLLAVAEEIGSLVEDVVSDGAKRVGNLAAFTERFFQSSEEETRAVASPRGALRLLVTLAQLPALFGSSEFSQANAQAAEILSRRVTTTTTGINSLLPLVDEVLTEATGEALGAEMWTGCTVQTERIAQTGLLGSLRGSEAPLEPMAAGTLPTVDLSRLPHSSSAFQAVELMLWSFTDCIYAPLLKSRAGLLDSAFALKAQGARVAVAAPQNSSAGIINLELPPANPVFFADAERDSMRAPQPGALVPSSSGIQFVWAMFLGQAVATALGADAAAVADMLTDLKKQESLLLPPAVAASLLMLLGPLLEQRSKPGALGGSAVRGLVSHYTSAAYNSVVRGQAACLQGRAAGLAELSVYLCTVDLIRSALYLELGPDAITAPVELSTAYQGGGGVQLCVLLPQSSTLTLSQALITQRGDTLSQADARMEAHFTQFHASVDAVAGLTSLKPVMNQMPRASMLVTAVANDLALFGCICPAELQPLAATQRRRLYDEITHLIDAGSELSSALGSEMPKAVIAADITRILGQLTVNDGSLPIHKFISDKLASDIAGYAGLALPECICARLAESIDMHSTYQDDQNLSDFALSPPESRVPSVIEESGSELSIHDSYSA